MNLTLTTPAQRARASKNGFQKKGPVNPDSEDTKAKCYYCGMTRVQHRAKVFCGEEPKDWAAIAALHAKEDQEPRIRAADIFPENAKPMR